MSSDSPSPPSLKHELRTPLNHIIGFCEMLIEEAEDVDGPSAGLVPDLRRIHQAGRRLLRVVNDLFDESIPESERLEESHIHHEVRTPLNQIIGYTELLQEEASDSGSDACRKDLETIHSAAHKLLELVLAHFGGGRFEVHEFERIDEREPVAILHRESGRGVESGESPLHATGAILLADDDQANREMLERRLRRLGHTVTTAGDGREVVEKIRDGKFDLLLLDLVMPVMDGYQVLEHLRANPPFEALPVIILSASDDSSRIARSIELGAEDYLPKPFDPALLQARIDSSLEKKRLRDRESSYLRAIQREKERSEDLLHVILPANIASELKEKGDVTPRRIENVAVLFADVVGFTSYCEKRDPETIHRELQAMVKAFEGLTASRGMEKIKTIGDAFMAAAGLHYQSGSQALDSIRCGLEMIEATARLQAGWSLRVGVHVGTVVAGVVGRQKYQYDIWGDTVNMAARMQTAAEPNSLYVNKATWRLIQSDCEGKSMGELEIKGRGRDEVFEVASCRC